MTEAEFIKAIDCYITDRYSESGPLTDGEFECLLTGFVSGQRSRINLKRLMGILELRARGEELKPSPYTGFRNFVRQRSASETHVEPSENISY